MTWIISRVPINFAKKASNYYLRRSYRRFGRLQIICTVSEIWRLFWKWAKQDRKILIFFQIVPKTSEKTLQENLNCFNN